MSRTLHGAPAFGARTRVVDAKDDRAEGNGEDDRAGKKSFTDDRAEGDGEDDRAGKNSFEDDPAAADARVLS